MTLYFYKDGTFSKKKKKEDTFISFTAIDISTDRKGPVYTLVKGKCEEEAFQAIVNIDLNVSYGLNDLPFDDDNNFHSQFICNTKERFYSIYPLIKQMIRFNTFSEQCLPFMGTHTFISSLDIKYRDKTITTIHLDESVSDKKIRKSFERLNMKTNVENILDIYSVQCIYFFESSNTWRYGYIDQYWKSFDPDTWIIFPLQYMETVYILPLHLMQKIDLINALSINIIHDLDERCYENHLENYFSFNGISEILEACVFIPQLILLDQQIYNSSITVQIELEIENVQIRLEIDSKQVKNPRNICLIKIIESLLEIIE